MTPDPALAPQTTPQSVHVPAVELPSCPAVELRDKFALVSLLIGPQVLGTHRALRICIVTLSVPALLVLLSLAVEHNASLPGAAVGLLEDWNILAMFAAYPFSIWLLHLALQRLSAFLADFTAAAGADGPSTAAAVSAAMRSASADSWEWRVFRLMILLLAFAWVGINATNRYYRASEVYFKGFWTSADYPITFWVTNIYTALVWGILSPMLVYFIVRIAALLYATGRISRQYAVLRYSLFLPERIPGFGNLSKLALSLCYLAMPFQLQALAYYFWIPRINEPLIIGLCVVAAASVVAFALPAHAIHLMLVDARLRLAKPLATALNAIYALTPRETGATDFAKQIESASASVKGCKEMIGIVESQPLWPLNIAVLARFLGTVFSALLVVVLSELLKKLF